MELYHQGLRLGLSGQPTVRWYLQKARSRTSVHVQRRKSLTSRHSIPILCLLHSLGLSLLRGLPPPYSPISRSDLPRKRSNSGLMSLKNTSNSFPKSSQNICPSTSDLLVKFCAAALIIDNNLMSHCIIFTKDH